ncbi:hypothetical protein COX93_00680 [Candidatus Nomurabacteria bacterium CG_4_10_14_0_2_um_filter_30_12]|uniref:Uncharacterized protein n=1 Tax=Candidatus Nomurabacteria bacterium CG_4_10_14_0_2_um_filter_30_12 TaxID=1974727 RepID=A0A2J0MGE7_9BACT|nr:MAG: hypothetical protein COX93_00680 [Candidatus Nomurabacteria bacterium CG_4_10_14_0_2_um_filter_30_12]
MSKIKIILILGIWVAILPYLGFPYSFKNILFSITGLVFISIGYLLYREQIIEGKIEKKTFDNFSENNNFEEIKIGKEYTNEDNKEQI